MIWVIVTVVAVIIFAAWIMFRRRPTGTGEASTAPAAVAPPRAGLGEAGEKREPAEVEVLPSEVAKEAPEEPVAEPVEAGLAAEGEAVTAEAGPETGAPPAEPAVKPAPSDELRTRVQAQLEESARLLVELKEAAAVAADDSPLAAGSVEIMEEGLQEIQALAERKQWSQARDKGEALHAQISLLLQSARREKTP